MRIAVVIGLVLASSACAEEESFISCPFDNSIEKICDATGSGSEFTCLVEKHPQCPLDSVGSSPCLSWKGSQTASGGVCTDTCKVDGECPSGSQCTLFSGSDDRCFCVRLSDLQSGKSGTRCEEAAAK